MLVWEESGTLGVRGFSCAVSGFAPVAREKKPLVPRVGEWGSGRIFGAEGVRKAGEEPVGKLMQQCLIFCNHEKD